MRYGARDHSGSSLGKSRQERTNMSASERVLWELLRKDRTGFRFRRQVRVGPYLLDFYCGEASLCVEVDGEQHSLRKEADQRRDGYLAQAAILTYRVPSLDLFEADTAGQYRHIEEVVRLCEERSGRQGKALS